MYQVKKIITNKKENTRILQAAHPAHFPARQLEEEQNKRNLKQKSKLVDRMCRQLMANSSNHSDNSLKLLNNIFTLNQNSQNVKPISTDSNNSSAIFKEEFFGLQITEHRTE